MKQFVITAKQSFTYYKTVYAENIAEAHLLAHEPSDDPEDDWTCHWDYDTSNRPQGHHLVHVQIKN